MMRALKQPSASGTWKSEGKHPGFLTSQCYWTGTGLERVCGRPACSVWVLDFLRERLHNPSLSNFESTFMKAGDSETKAGTEESAGEIPGGALLQLPRKCIGKE